MFSVNMLDDIFFGIAGGIWKGFRSFFNWLVTGLFYPTHIARKIFAWAIIAAVVILVIVKCAHK